MKLTSVDQVFINVYKPDARWEFVNIKIEIPFTSQWSFKLMPEGALVYFFKSFNLVKEIQIGDPEWDRQIYIVGDAQKINDLFTQFPLLKEGTLSLIDRKFHIEVKNSGLILKKVGIATDLADQEILTIEPELEKILSSLVAAGNAKLIPEKEYNKAAYYTFLGSTLLILLSLITTSILSSEENIYHLAGNVGFYGFLFGLLIGTCLLFLWRIIRKLHSRSHYEFLTLFLCLPLGFAIAGSSCGFYLNRILDFHEGSIQEAVVSKKFALRNKNGITYSLAYTFPIPLKIRSNPTVSHFEERISIQKFHLSMVGDKMMVRIFPGYFGQPWVMKIR